MIQNWRQVEADIKQLSKMGFEVFYWVELLFITQLTPSHLETAWQLCITARRYERHHYYCRELVSLSGPKLGTVLFAGSSRGTLSSLTHQLSILESVPSWDDRAASRAAWNSGASCPYNWHHRRRKAANLPRGSLHWRVWAQGQS